MKVNQQKYTLQEVVEWNNYLNLGHSLAETSEYFNVKYKTCVNLLTRHGFRQPCRVCNKKHSLNNQIIDYFDVIDSHEKAYFLGLLYSDGYICSSNYPTSKQMGIALQLQDDYIIKRLHSVLNLKTTLNVYKNSIKLVVTNKHLYDSLTKLGLSEDKSHKDFELPSIDSKFMNSFLLGYFDGDGCITIKSTGYVTITICGNSKKFFERLQTYLKKNEIETTIRVEKRKYNPLYILYFKGHQNHLKLKELMYKNSPIYLKRKHDKFMKISC